MANSIVKVTLAVLMTVQTPVQLLAQSLPAPAATALPTGGQVAAGRATINQTGTAGNPTLTIQQGSDRAIINWNSFDIGQNAKVDFIQPDSQSVALNRVQSSNPSQIFGQLTANGQVYLVNPNGVYFSPTSTADVGGLVATTMGITDADFMAGRTTFTRNGATGKVVNDGTLTSRNGGYVALLAPEVRNAGVIVAQSGTVALASGEAVTMNFDPGHSLTNLIVAPSKIDALVENQKIVKAPDGKVIVSAQAFNDLTQGVIKNSGSMSAKGISKAGGEIVLGASTAITNDGTIKAKSKAGNGGTVKLDAKSVSQNGTIDVSTTAEGGKGGTVMVTGDLLTLKAGSMIAANGPAGGGTVLVGGDWQGSNGVRQAQSVVVEQDAAIQANATQAGDGGKVVLWSDVTNKSGFTRLEGSIEAKGFGGGNGGQVETSGHVVDASNGTIDAASGGGKNGLWLLDPYNVTIGSAGTAITGDFTSSSTSTITAASIGTLLNAGTNVTISTGAIGSPGTDAGNITISSAISKTSGAAVTLTLIAANSISSSVGISTNGNALNLVLDTGGGTGNLSGVLSLGAGTVTKQGAGSITLSSSNTYTGATIINAGTLVTTNALSLGTVVGGGSVTINSGATLDIQSNIGAKPILINAGGMIASSGGTGITTSNLALSSDTTINVAGAGSSLTLSGVISGAGYTITKTGSGILTLNAANTFTGNLVLNAGNTYASVASSFDGSGNLVSGALGAGANLVIAGGAMTVTTANTVNGLSATSGILSLTSTLAFGGDNSSTSFAGSITGNSQLIKNGIGTFLNGSTTTNSTTYVINNGVMKLNSSGAASNSSVTTGANGTLDLNGFNAGTSNSTMHWQGSGYNGQGALINSSATASTVFGYYTYWDSTSDFLVNATGNITLKSAYVKNMNTPTIVKTGAGVLDATNLGGTNASNNGVGYTAYFGNNSYNIQQGAATIGNQYSSATLGNVALSNGATVTITFSGTQTYSGVISGNGNVVYSTNATATISGNSTYTGSTTISGTAIVMGASTHYTNGVIDYSPLGSTPVVSLANLAAASLALGANSIELYALSGGGSTGGNLNLGTGALTVGTGNTNTTYTGLISGTAGATTGSLTKVGTGTLTLSGFGNTYSGLTNVNGGTLVAANVGALGIVNATPSLSTITVNSGGTLEFQTVSTSTKPLTLNGGTLQNSGTAGTYTGAISLTADSFINVPNTGLGLTLSGVMSNSGGTFGLTKTGAGKAILSGTNTFGGDININAGSLVLGSTAGFGAITKTVYVNSGGLLDVQTTTSNAYPTVMNGGSIGNSSAIASVYSGAVSLLADTQFNIGSTGGLTLTGSISGNFGITKMGVGTGGIVFSAANSYTGITTISTGSVSLGSFSSLAGDFGNSPQIINNGTIYYTRQNSLTITAPISGTGGIVLNNQSSTLTLAGANTFTGPINLSGVGGNNSVIITGSVSPLVAFTTANTSASTTIDFSSHSDLITVASVTGIGGGTVKISSGGLTISGGNGSYAGRFTGTGPLTINGSLTLTSITAVDSTIPITITNTGSLTMSGNGWLGNSSKVYSNLLTNNGTFTYGTTGYAQILSGGVTGTGNIINSGLSLTMKGTVDYTGTTSITYGSVVFGDSTTTGAAATFPTGNITLSNNGILVLGTTADATFANNVTGVGYLQKYGPSNITLTGTNSFASSGGVSLDNYYGGLIIGNANALPSGLIRFQGTFSSGASVDFNGLTVNNAISLISGANGTSRINVQNSSTTPVTINGNIDITKSLSTYSGLTIGGIGDIVMNGVFTNSSTTNGSGNLIKQGTGTLTINTASTRNGPVDVINAGTVLLNGSGSLFTGTASGLTMTGGSLIFSDKALVLGGGLNMSGSPIITGNGVSSLSVTASSTLAGTITTSGTQNYGSSSTLNGSLTLNTTNANVTTPYMMVPSGQSGNYDLVLNLGTGNFSLSSGSFGVGGSTTVAKTFRMNGTGGVSIAGSGGIFALNDIVINGTFTGPAVTSTNGPVTLTGGISAYVASNTVTITGGSAGAVTVGDVSNVGGLAINSTNANSVMSGTISNSTGNFTFNQASGFTTGTLTFTGNNSSNLPLGLYGGTFKLGSSQFGTGAIGELTGSPTLDLNGQTLANPLTLNNLGVGSNGAVINSNTGTDAVLNGTVTLSTTSVNFGGAGNTIINGVIGAGQMAYTLKKVGTGSVTLNGVNTFGHTLQIAAGTLIATNASSLNTSTTSLSVSAGATLDLQNVVMTANRPLSMSGTLIASTGTSSYAGAVGLGANAVIDAGTGATLTLSSITATSLAYSKGAGAGTVSLYLNNATMSGAFTNNGGTTIFTGTTANYTGAFTINSGTVQVGAGAVIGGTSNIVDNGNLVFNRSGTTLSAMMGSGTITGTGNVTVIAASSALNIDRTITLTGANSSILIEANANAAAGATLTSDLTLTNMMTTTATGTITIFAGSPTATPATGATSVLSAKMTGATGAVQYKNYYSSASAVSGTVSGTRNFYYRSRPSLTITGGSLVDSKYYDGTLTVAATPTPGSVSGNVDGDSMGAIFQSASYQTAGAGVNKPITATFNIGSTNAAWTVTGYATTVTGGTYQGTITPAPLTINAQAQSTTYGQSLALGTSLFSTSGLVNNETITSVALYYGNTGTVSTVPTGVNAATYAGAIRPASPSGVGFNAANYNITYNNAALTVDQALLTAPSMSVASRAYDGTLVVVPTVGALSGLVGAETLNVSATGLVDSANAGSRTATVAFTLANGTGLASNYRISNATQAVVISPRVLTVATSTTDRPYDGTSSIGVTMGAVSNLVGTETLTLSATGLSDSPNAGARTATVTYGLADGSNGGLASNYSLASVALPVTIQQRVLTISGTQITDRQYDGTTTVGVVAGTQIGNLVGTETVQVAASATVPSKDAGTYTATASYTLSDGSNGGLGGNYTLAPTTHASVTISPKVLSIVGTTVTDRAYDATTAIDAVVGVVTGLVGQEQLGVTGAGTAASANAGAQSTTVNYSLSNGSHGGLAGNYSLAATNHTVTITPANLVLTGSRPYDQTSSVDGSVLVATGLNGDTFSVSGSGHSSNLNSVNAGIYPLATLTGLSLGANRGQGDANNYQLSTTGSSITITKIPITLTGDLSGTVSKTYDGNASLPLTGPVPYAVAGGLLNGDNVSFSGSPAFDSANAGPRAITIGTLIVTGPSAGNYSLSFTNGTGVINKAPLDVTANNAAGFYGQTPTLTVSYSGFVNGENATTANVTSSVTRDPNTNVLTPSLSASNYYARTLTTGLYTQVAADKMLITLNDASKVYGADYAMPGFTALSASYSAVDPNNPGNTLILPVTITNTAANQYSYNDGAGGLGSFRISTSALLASKVGNYQITVAPADFTVIGTPHFNAMQVQDGVLTVTPRPIAVQASGVNKIYDGNTAVASYSVTPTGLMSGDIVTATANSGIYADKNVGSGKSYTLSGVSLAGADAANYYVAAGSDFTGSNGQVTAKSVSVSGLTAANKVYDGTQSAVVAVNNAVVNGLVAGDVVTVSATGLFDTKNAGSGKTVNLSSSFSGADAGNYTIASQATTAADITPKALTITGTVVADRAYDGTRLAGATQGVLTGFVGSETVTSSISSALFADKNVGTQAATLVYQLANGSQGGLASNYSLANSVINAQISQREVSLSATRTYDATTTLGAGIVTVTTGVGGETLAYSGALANSKTVATGNFVSALTLLDATDGSGGVASNYKLPDMTVAGAANSVSFTRASLTVTGSVVDAKVYDGTVAATIRNGSLSGVLSTDQVTLSQSASFNSRHAANSVSVTAANSISGVDADNYSVTQPTGLSAAITPKDITVSSLTVPVSKVYDGTTTAAISTAGQLSGQAVGNGTSADGLFYTIDAVSLTGTAHGTYNSKDVASANLVTVSGLSLTGAGASNYTLVSPTQAATITAREVSLSATRTYDATTALGAGTVNVTTGVGGETLAYSGGVANSKTVATGNFVSALTLLDATDGSGGVASNYKLPDMTVAGAANSVSFTRASLTVTGSVVDAKVYDGTVAATIRNGSLSGVLSTDQVTLSQSASFNSRHAANSVSVTAANSISGVDADNYSVTQPTGLSAAITPKDITVSSLTVPVSKVYDGTTTAAISTAGQLSGQAVGNGTSADGLFYTIDAISLTGTAQGTYNSKDVASANLVTVSGLSLTGAGASNYTLVAPTQAATITPKSITVTGLTLPASKVYDATTAGVVTGTAGFATRAVGFGTGADGAVYTLDTGVSLSGAPVSTYDSKDVATASLVTLSGLSLGGAGSGNYTLAAMSQAATIIPKTLTMSGLVVASTSKVYDGTTAASLSQATGALQTAIAAGSGTAQDGAPYSGDNVSLSGTASANFASKNVGSGLSIVFSGVGLSGADTANYLLTQQTPLATGAITAKALTVSGSVVSDKIYDGSTTASLSSGTLVGVIAADLGGVVLTQSASFSDANAASGKTVTAADSLSGAASGNYSLTQPTGLQASITAKSVTVSGLWAADKVYDGTVTASVSGGTLVGVLAGDLAQVGLSQTGGFSTASAGTSKNVTSTSGLTGVLAGNYSLIQPTGLTASITPKTLTVSGTAVATKTYDATTDASLTGGTLVGVVAGDVLTTTLATPTGSFIDANAGSGKPVTPAYSLAGVSSGNYRLVQPTGLTGTIDKATLTVSPTAGQTKIYGGADGPLAYSLTGYVGGEVSATGLGGVLTRASGENVGSYAFGTSQLSSTNYQFVLAAGAPGFAITPAALTVTANTDAKFVTENDRTNFNSVSYSGFVNGETAAVLGGTLAITRTNPTQNNAGTYAGVLVPTGLTSANYTITNQAGNFVIVPAGQLLIRAANVSTTYGTAPVLTAGSVKYLRDINGVSELKTLVQSPNDPTLYSDGVGGSVSFSLTANGPVSSAGWLRTGSYAMSASGLVKQGNNFLNDPVVIGMVTVTQKALTPSAAPSKTYDGTTQMDPPVLTLSGLITGDMVGSTASGAYQSRHAGQSVAYSIANIDLTGADQDNYYLTTTGFSASNGIITPKAVTLTPQAASKTYDGQRGIAATPADLGVLSQQLGVAGDNVTAITLTYDTKNAGQNKSLSASSAIIADGNGGQNYSVSYQANTTSQIGQAVLSVAGSSVVTKDYDGTTAATLTGGTLVGVVGSDQVVLNASGLFASANVGSGMAVTSTSGLTGTEAGNYSLTQPAGLTGTIIPKVLTVSGTVVADKTYSGTTDASIATLGSLQGLVGNQTLSLSGGARFTDANAGNGKAVVLTYTLSNGTQGGMSGNYSLATATTTASIGKAALTVTANADARFVAQGDAFNYNGVSYSGFVHGETPAVLGGSLLVTRTNPTQNAAATYAGVLSPSGLTSGNYTISYQAGDYTIVPAQQVLIKMANVSQTYGQALVLAPASVQYMDGNDVLTTLTQVSGANNTYAYQDGLGGTLDFTLTPSGSASSSSGFLNVGRYAVAGASIASSGQNFSGSPVFVGMIAVNQASLTASTNQAVKTYDGSAQMGTVAVQLAGVASQNGTTDAVSTSGTGLFAGKNAGNGLSYSVSGLALSGSDAGNYYLTGGSNFSGSDGIITPKSVTLTAQTSQKTYDGTTQGTASAADLAALSSQLGVAGDKVDAVTLTFDNRNAGTGKTLTLSNASLADGQAGQNYLVSYATNSTGTITPKSVTLTPQAATKIYDAGTGYSANASDLSVLSGQLGVAGDQVIGAGAIYAGKDIGNKALDLVSAVISDGNNGGNYQVNYGSGSILVTPKTISVVNSTVTSKTYDKSAAATIAGGTLSGVEAGDLVTLTQSGLFASVNAGSGIAVSVTQSIAAPDAGNYILSPTTGLTGTIAPRALTVSYTGQSKIYDTSTLASVTTTDDRLSGDSVTINRTAAFTSPSVGTGQTIQVTGVTLSGGDAGNYTVLASGSATANITRRLLVVTGTTVTSRDYDGSTTAGLSGGVVQGLLGTDQVSLVQSGQFASKNIGTAIAVTATDLLTGADAGNYSIEQQIGLSGTIRAKALTVTGTSVDNKIYDGSRAATLTGGILSGVIGGETVNLVQSGLFAARNAGQAVQVTATNSLAGPDAGNYVVIQPTGLLADITRRTLTVAGTVVATKSFDAKTEAKVSGGRLVGLVDGDQVVLNQAGAFVSPNAATSVAVIMNDTITGADASNYLLVQPTGLTGTINSNTPILYPTAPTTAVQTVQTQAATPAPASSDAVVSPAGGTVGGGWKIETAVSSSGTASVSSSVSIKVSSDSNAIQSGVDVLQIGKVVTLDAAGDRSPIISSASINMLKGFEAGRTLLELNETGPISISIDNQTGRVKLSGAATVAEYNKLIQSLRLKLNGASQRRILSMNIGLVDQNGNREQRVITLSPAGDQQAAGRRIEVISDMIQQSRSDAPVSPALARPTPDRRAGLAVEPSGFSAPSRTAQSDGNRFTPVTIQ